MIKKTCEGKLLVEIRGDESVLGVVKYEFIKEADEACEMRELQRKAKVEVCDLDG